MALPDFQTIMLPLLRFLENRGECSFRDVVEALAAEFQLTDEERRALLPSGSQPVFNNRVGWARTYLKKAGLIETPRRGWLRITERGLSVLQQKLDRVHVQFLMQFPEFQEFWSRSTAQSAEQEPRAEGTATAEERLEEIYEQIRKGLRSELLEQVRRCSPPFFEKLVLRLLVAMGYGGSFVDAARAVGGSDDEGIDGVIKQDPLGLDVVYIQAKRWDRPIGRPEIQRFAGALQGRRARKGVFITTSSFTQEAKDYVARIDSNIVVIDGPQLADLMIEHDVGVSTTTIYRLKKVDTDFFAEE